MGTLTADCPRLDAHCPHKLATSCRLTSTLNCCACADERPHSLSYRVYIDGVGFVQRGTRWQSYCWFCKEFWSNRLAATYPPLEAAQTRIPDTPDQTEFLERWFEFHQGYRIAKNTDGTEQRIAVLGEPLREVSPGFLPRTLAELRAGRENDATRPLNRFRRRRLSAEEARPEEPQQSLEDALSTLLDQALEEEEGPAEPQEAQEAQEASELEPASDMPRRESVGLVRPLNRLEREAQRARERFTRLFGSREDVQRDDYESPLSTMYNRAWNRYRQAEERRTTGDTAVPSSDQASAQERRDIEDQLRWGVLQDSRRELQTHETTDRHNHYDPTLLSRDELRPSSPLQDEEAILQALRIDSLEPSMLRPVSVYVSPTNAPPNTTLTTTSSAVNASTFSTDIRVSLEQITSELARLRTASEAVASARHALHAQRNPDEPRVNLDNQPDRPPPKSEADMVKNLACQVCYSQVADIALVPCGHMVMCQWCADAVIPVKHSHLPVRPSKCPMCRKQVRQRYKIHIG